MFITFEGMDGSGKTSQIKRLATSLQQHHYNVLLTREPGGTRIGDEIRTVLHDLEHIEMQPTTELLLYVASRAQLVGEVIRPHLAAGGIVLSDRYADSSYAYQGYGHGFDIDTLRSIMGFATSGLHPDLTIFLDISPEEALARRRAAADQGEEFNRLDAKALDYHHRVYAGYQHLIAAEPSRWQVVDARLAVDDVFDQIVAALAQHLQLD